MKEEGKSQDVCETAGADVLLYELPVKLPNPANSVEPKCATKGSQAPINLQARQAPR